MTKTLSASAIEAMRAMVARMGVKAAAAEIGIAEGTFVRALAGLGLHEGTRTQIRCRLADMAASAAAGST